MPPLDPHPATAADRNLPVRILVVDDNPDILSGTARLLERAGYVVDQAACGAAVPPAVQTHRPDLVLLDRDLPDLDGLEVCRRIKQSAAMADTFVIIISASYTASDEQAEGLESGADGYIARPIANRELLARVSSFVRIRRLTLSLRDQARQLQEQNESLQQQRATSLTLMAEAVAARDRAETELAARTQAEAEIARINRLYHALSHVNQAIVRVATHAELFAEMCRVLVEFAQFRLAWIGIVDEATHAVNVAARHGQAQEYLEHIRVFADERAEGRGPTGTAIRENRSIVVNDFMHDERTRLWQSAGVQAGIRASAAFPIHFQGRACGALTVYAGESGFFQEREITLLEEAAADISFALEHLASEALRIKAEETLRRSQTMLMRTESIAHVGSWEWDVATDTVTWSDELFRIFQRDPAEGAPAFAEHPALYHPDDAQRLTQAVELAISQGTPYELALRAMRKDGATRLCLANGHAEMGPDHKAVRLFGSFQDITERTQAEEQMAQQLDELRRWHAVTLGREGRVGELKREINALATRLGEPPPYGTQQQ